MKFRKLILTSYCAALMGLSAQVNAEKVWETEKLGSFTFSANMALTTDYVWRYVSQSDEKGAIQGGFDVGHSIGLYAGTWASNVDFDYDDEGEGDPSMEWDLYGGFAHEFDFGLGIDLGVINYRYPGADDLEWVEGYGGLSYTLWGVSLSGSINYSDDVFGSDEDGYFYTGAAEYTFDTKFPITIGGDFGYYDLDDYAEEVGLEEDTYWGWRLGVSVDVHGFVFDVSYHDTNDDGEDMFDDWADDRFVATLSTSF